jgi:hypothetical protein
MFVRVAHRRGWDVEIVRDGGEVETANFPDRAQALEHARALNPDWIEVGEVVLASAETAQHHRWTTLRRQPDGSYQSSGLRWGGPAAAR